MTPKQVRCGHIYIFFLYFFVTRRHSLCSHACYLFGTSKEVCCCHVGSPLCDPKTTYVLCGHISPLLLCWTLHWRRASTLRERNDTNIMFILFFKARSLSYVLSPQHSGDKTATGPVPCSYFPPLLLYRTFAQRMILTWTLQGKGSHRSYSLWSYSFPSWLPEFSSATVFNPLVYSGERNFTIAIIFSSSCMARILPPVLLYPPLIKYLFTAKQARPDDRRGRVLTNDKTLPADRDEWLSSALQRGISGPITAPCDSLPPGNLLGSPIYDWNVVWPANKSE